MKKLRETEADRRAPEIKSTSEDAHLYASRCCPDAFVHAGDIEDENAEWIICDEADPARHVFEPYAAFLCNAHISLIQAGEYEVVSMKNAAIYPAREVPVRECRD